MKIIRPYARKVSRYATLNRPHYICPDCLVYIVRDRHEDMFLCLQCGRKETRSEFRQTLIANVAASQAEQKKMREEDAKRERIELHLQTEAGKDALNVVYYINFRGLIKIGTTRDLRTRMVELPWDELLLTEPGGYKQESSRHRQFASLNEYGEWFRAGPELMEFIESRREEMAEHNSKWYLGLPSFPWARGDVAIPGWRDMVRNAADVIEFNDKIQVDEMEHSGIYYCKDPEDEVRP